MISCVLLFCLLLLSDGCVRSEQPALKENDDTLAWYKTQWLHNRKEGNANEEILTLTGIARYFRDHQQVDSALYYYTQKSDVARANENWHELVNSWASRCRCYEMLGMDEEAGIALDSAVKVSSYSEDPTDLGYALEERGVYFYSRQQYDSALRYWNKEMKEERVRNDSFRLSTCLSNLGMVHADKGEYSISVLRYEEAIAIADSLNRDTISAIYSQNIAIVLTDKGDYDLALNYLLNAARFYDQVKMVVEQATCYTSIGNIHLQRESYDEALRFHSLSYALRDSIQNEQGIAISLTNLGETYLRRGEYDTALACLNRSLAIKERIGDRKLIASALNLLGEAAFLQRDYVQAEKFYRRAIQLETEIGHAPGEASTLNRMAQLYFVWNKPDSAERMLQRARVILRDVPARKKLLDNYRIAIDMMRAAGDVEGALYFSGLYISLKDSLSNYEKEDALAGAEVKYETEKKDQEIQLLDERETARIKAFNQQQKILYISIAGIALLIIALVSTFYALNTRKKALVQKQAMMSELHHRVKNNLQVLADMLQLQQGRIKDPAMKEMVKAVEHRVTAMFFVHRGLYGNDPGSLVSMRDYIPELLKNLARSFGYDYEKVSAGLQVDDVQMKADDALNMGFVCNELVSNAFKYAFPFTENPSLVLSLLHNDNELILTVADNGPGIPAGLNDAKPSTFGLRLVELFSRDLNATVTIESNHPGVRVQLVLPFKDQHT